jgi:hypothetical protein
MKGLALALASKTLLPLLVAFLVVPVVDFIKKRLIPAIDGAPPAVKAGVALVMSTVATALTSLSGVGVPADLTQWDGALVSALLTWVTALALKDKKRVAQKDEAIAKLASAANNPFALPDTPTNG